MTTTKITPSTDPALSLADAKTHLRETLVSPSNDDYIKALVAAVTEECESRLQRALMPSVWQYTGDAFPRCGRSISLQMPPLIEVDWIKYLDVDGVLQTLDPSAYTVTPELAPGVVSPAPGAAWPTTHATLPGPVRVQFRAGYADAAKIPPAIGWWIRLAVAELYERRSLTTERGAIPRDFADGLLDIFKIRSI